MKIKKAGINNQYPQPAKPMKSKLKALKNKDKIATKRNTIAVANVPMAEV
jgi:hypothetical protein